MTLFLLSGTQLSNSCDMSGDGPCDYTVVFYCDACFAYVCGAHVTVRKNDASNVIVWCKRCSDKRSQAGEITPEYLASQLDKELMDSLYYRKPRPTDFE